MLLLSQFWAGLILGLILFTLAMLGIFNNNEGAALAGGISLIASIFIFSLLFCNNWEVSKIDKYEKQCKLLKEAREYAVKEEYSALKTAAYLQPFIEDSIAWYGRINHELIEVK